MSIHLQKHIQQRRLFGHKTRFDEQVYSDKYIVSHMTLEKELPGHGGCINTLDWSASGDLLLTGSDDTRLNIYSTFDDYQIVKTIETGHSANIFTAKFMPQTSNRIVLSGAGDAELRIFDLTHPQSPLDSMYVCHSDQLKRICTLPDNPFEFFTCSQDGTVRHFDLRTPHMCSPHNVRSFITGTSKPAKQHPLPRTSELYYGCFPPVVDYSKFKIELNSMSISKLYPHYFALAGMNDYIFLHDRRMLPSSSPSSLAFTGNMLKASKCIKRFSPRLDGVNRLNKHITACKFSDANGYELIGSWSSDGVYLFNIHDSPAGSSSQTETLQSSTRPSLSVDDTDNIRQRKPLWKTVVRRIKQRQNHAALDASNDLLQHIKNNTQHRSLLDSVIGETCALLMVVTAHFSQRLDRDNWFSDRLQDPDEDWNRYFFSHELETTQELLQEAEERVNTIPGWQGAWCLAVGYWTARGGSRSIAGANRSWYLEKSLHFIEKARRVFMQQSRESTASLVIDQLDSVYWELMRMFLIDLLIAGARELSDTAGTNNAPDHQEDPYKWAEYMYITQYNTEQVRSFVTLQRAMTTAISDVEEDNESHHSSSSSSSNSTSNDDSNDLGGATFLASQEFLNILRRLDSDNTDLYHGQDDSDSDSFDLDFDEINALRKYRQTSFETDVGVVKPRAKYVGHLNIETIKDVNFYGRHDEYIVSGSDGGYLFIWDKKTTKLVEILHADEEVVNVVKGHPTLPILAVSGIDSTTKIFTPTSRPFSSSRIKEPHLPGSYSTSSQMYEAQDIIRSNREASRNSGADLYVTQSMIAAFTRHRLSILAEDNTDSEDEMILL